MGREGERGEKAELKMGRRSLLVGLRSSSQSVDQLALMYRELWRMSRRLRRAMSLTSFCIEEAVCRQVFEQVNGEDDE